MRIHHATIAKAKKFQITLTIEDNEVVATNKKGERLTSGLQGNKVLEDAITKATGKPAKGKATKSLPPTHPAIRGANKAIKAANAAKRKAEREDDEETGVEEEIQEAADDGEETGTRSVVKAKYKTLYKPTKNRCGDELSHRMNQHCSRENDAGEMRIDLGALRKFAKANGVWVEGYASLKSRTGTFNGGMAMMNVNNRLRAKIRQAAKREEKFDIVWN